MAMVHTKTHTHRDRYTGTYTSKAKAKAGAGAMEKSLQKVIIYFMLFCAVPTRRKRRTDRQWSRSGHQRLEAGGKLQLGPCSFIYEHFTQPAAHSRQSDGQNSAQPQAAASNIMQIFFLFW